MIRRTKKKWSLLWAARFVSKWEGFLPHAFLDTIANPPVWTIGYGHTGDVDPHDFVTKDQARRILADDLRTASAAVDDYIKVKLTVRQRIALISFTFNCGVGALKESTLRKKLNKHDYRAAADEFLKWNKAGGVEVLGLTRRRRAERKMFLSKMPRR
jgi:lysozyme